MRKQHEARASSVRRKPRCVLHKSSPHREPNRRSGQRVSSIVDYRKFPAGTLMKRSTHWLHEIPHRKRGRLGMVTDRYWFRDKQGQPACWPLIHWEGAESSCLEDPVDVDPYRRKHARR